jgi:hypothetical protein
MGLHQITAFTALACDAGIDGHLVLESRVHRLRDGRLTSKALVLTGHAELSEQTGQIPVVALGGYEALLRNFAH